MLNSNFHISKVVSAISLACSVAFLSNQAVAAANSGNLQDILHFALTSDPKIQEAKANVSVAESQTNISRAGHLPILSLTNNQMLKQHHNDESDRKKSSFGVKGQVNLFAWGGVNAAVERDQHKEAFYQHKYDETREQLGKTIGTLYLTALRAKENIAIYQKSLARHERILNDVAVVTDFDEGRESESTEVESRLFQVKSSIADQERILHTALSQLSRYTRNPMTASQLQDPFARLSANNIISQYKNHDLSQNPTYLAQVQELESTKSGVKVAESKRLPAINLEGNVNRNGYEVYLGTSWNLFDMGNHYAVEQNRYSEVAATAKLNEILLEVAEQTRTSEIEMQRSMQRADIVKKQIRAQEEVVKSYELQFKIARRSLLDVLNAYQELSGVELSEINARNDFRDAALNYLVAQSQVSNWAGVVKLNMNKATASNKVSTAPVIASTATEENNSKQVVKQEKEKAKAAPIVASVAATAVTAVAASELPAVATNQAPAKVVATVAEVKPLASSEMMEANAANEASNVGNMVAESKPESVNENAKENKVAPAGQVVVFAGKGLDAETVGVFINGRFLSAIKANTQFNQALCSGSYKFEAITADKKSVNNAEKQVHNLKDIKVESQNSVYLEIVKTAKGWGLKQVSQKVWQKQGALGATNQTLLRRLPKEMTQCQ